MTNVRPQLIITWVSGSWKTTVMKWLVKEYPNIYAKPTQYTTRLPRFDWELDDYVFLNYSQFIRKLLNGDFVEYVEYNWELYAVWAYFDTTKTNVFIAEPVGREALKKYFKLNSIPYVATYISIPESDVKSRLEQRWTTVDGIEERMEDFKYFTPSAWDKIIQGLHSEEKVLDSVHNYVEWASYRT